MRFFSYFIVNCVVRNVVLSFMFYVVFLSAYSACAAGLSDTESGDELVDRYRYRIEQTLESTKSMKPDCLFCAPYVEGKSSTITPACQKTYRNLFKIKDQIKNETASDRTIEISIAFGYMDYLNQVEDGYAETAFATDLARPCQKGANACGFSRSPKDAELLSKKITLLGPDGITRTREIKIRLRASSISGDELQNRDSTGEPNAEQIEKSESTRAFFLNSLKKADIAFYIGHARDGGGPDFSPPHVSAETHRTDLGWHRAHPAGYRAMIEALRASQTPATVIGIFACYAGSHFRQSLRQTAPGSALILANQSEFESAVGHATASLDSLLGHKCEQDFKNSLSVISAIGDFKIERPTVDGLFRH